MIAALTIITSFAFGFMAGTSHGRRRSERVLSVVHGLICFQSGVRS